MPLPLPKVKVRWRQLSALIYSMICAVSITVAFTGRVDSRHTHDDVLWWISTVLFCFGALAALYSIFRRDRFYARVGAMAIGFFMRGVLYPSTNSLPDYNEWAASSINMLCGVLIVLVGAFDTDALR